MRSMFKSFGTKLKFRVLDLVMFTLFILSAFTLFNIRSATWPTFLLKLVSGICGFIFIPGLLISATITTPKLKGVSLALVYGFLFQLLNIYVIWMLYLFHGPVDFLLTFSCNTLLLIVFIIIYRYLSGKPSLSNDLTLLMKPDLLLVVISVLYLILAIYCQQWAPTPHTDGAAYLDIARNVVEKGVFKSNKIFQLGSWANVASSTGIHIHMFGYFALVLFFVISDVSLLSAKAMLIFGGFLIITVVYLLTRELFDRNTARIACFVVATSAVLLTHVSLVGGPEIPSALFILLTMYLLVIGASSGSKSAYLISGLSLFVAWYAWFFNFYVFMSLLPLLYAYTASRRGDVSGVGIIFMMFSIVSFILDRTIVMNFIEEVVGIPLPLLTITSAVAVYTISLRKRAKLRSAKMMFLMMLVLTFLFFAWRMSVGCTPEVQSFHEALKKGVTWANIEQGIGTLSRALSFSDIEFYWDMYKNGIYRYLGQVTVLLALVSLTRLGKLKETLILVAFPLLQAFLWSMFVTIDGFQPRFIVCSSVFYSVLVASSIKMISKNAINYVRNNKKIGALVAKKKLKFDLKKLTYLLVLILLILSYVGLTLSTYTEGKKVMEGWNYPEKYGWNDAIAWIKNNTSPNDLIGCVYGSYLSWYTGRRSVSTYNIVDMNMSNLIKLIRVLKVNYLVVDVTFRWRHGLKELYDSPRSFLGSNIVFTSQDGEGKKVVIYNVTNIAYGSLITYKFVPEWKDIENWVSPTWYGFGNISVNQDAIRVDFKVIERPMPSAMDRFFFVSPIDSSAYSYVEFSIKVPVSKHIVFGVVSEDNYYYSYVIENDVYNQWVKLVVDLNDYQYKNGNPSFKHVEKLNFIVAGLPVGETATFWVKDVKFVRQEYVSE